MNNQQLDIFNQMEVVNPLKDRYVCLSGKFRVPDKKLRETLLSIGQNLKGGKKKKKIIKLLLDMTQPNILMYLS